MRPRLVVAALSARMLAESAQAAGFDVIALDVFGDRDTRAAAVAWQSIGAPGSLHIDGAALAAALRRCDGVGWIAGAGCEPHLAAACAAAPKLPLLGNTPDEVAAVRDPLRFFAALRELGIAHPETRHEPAADAAGWLVKDFAGSGGWHIRPASRGMALAAPSQFVQRVQVGEPVSALFVGNGRDARMLGLQRQLVAPLAGRPHVFRGVVGPIDRGPAVRREAERIVAALVARLALRGLGSVDALLDGDTLHVLEVNPRPTASLALYDEAGSVLRAHLAACLDGALPDTAAPTILRGTEIVFAPRDIDGADRLPARPWRHDLPAGRARISRGDPLCSVSAQGVSEGEVLAGLSERRHDVLTSLERPT